MIFLFFPVVSSAVPVGLVRLRTTITDAHERSDIEHVMDVIKETGEKLEVILIKKVN